MPYQTARENAVHNRMHSNVLLQKADMKSKEGYSLIRSEVHYFETKYRNGKICAFLGICPLCISSYIKIKE